MRTIFQLWWWRPGRMEGKRVVGKVLEVGTRKAIIEITDPDALKYLLDGRAVRNLTIRPELP